MRHGNQQKRQNWRTAGAHTTSGGRNNGAGERQGQVAREAAIGAVKPAGDRRAQPAAAGTKELESGRCNVASGQRPKRGGAGRGERAVRIARMTDSRDARISHPADRESCRCTKSARDTVSANMNGTSAQPSCPPAYRRAESAHEQAAGNRGAQIAHPTSGQSGNCGCAEISH